MSLELLKKLCETPGIAGREERVRELVIKEMEPLVDEIKVDAMGNVIGIKRGKSKKKLMLAGHMDEIGFIVKHIDDKGFLHINPVGGFDPRNLVAQRVIVHGRKDIHGILMPGIKPKHLLSDDEANKTPKISDFFIDIGMSKDEAREVVRIGDFVTMDRNFIEFGNHITCKAFDDRMGVYVMLEALRRIKEHDVDIYAVATVQEEQGLRGATTGAFGVQPDIGVALDVTIAADIPGSSEHDYVTRLGGGAAIKVMDSASISNYKLVDFIRDLAEKKDINYQMEVLPRGGTDAGAIERSRTGCPVVTISIPTRYVHTVVESAHKEDVEACCNLLARFIEEAHKGDFSL